MRLVRWKKSEGEYEPCPPRGPTGWYPSPIPHRTTPHLHPRRVWDYAATLDCKVSGVGCYDYCFELYNGGGPGQGPAAFNLLQRYTDSVGAWRSAKAFLDNACNANLTQQARTYIDTVAVPQLQASMRDALADVQKTIDAFKAMRTTGSVAGRRV